MKHLAKYLIYIVMDSNNKGDLQKLCNNFQHEFIECYTGVIDEI